MIISRTPFRISFAGGGSDLPSFYREETGAVVSTTIDKYMYLAIHPYFDKSKIQLKYSKTELVDSIEEIRHPIFREVLSLYNLKGIDLNSIADIPAGTGLGSSSSFTVGLLNVVNAYLNKACSSQKLAELACDIEINKVGSPIGKQDQYAAAFGGLNFITFYGDETVNVEKIIMNPEKKKELQDNLMMIYIGGKHSAKDILKEQQAIKNGSKKFSSQREMVKQAYQMKSLLENNNIDDVGRILHEGWMLKKTLTDRISNDHIDEIYNRGIKAGALGGKLLGAGGAGFILFYCPAERKEYFRKSMQDFAELKFSFDYNGSKIIYIGDNF
ncbi:MAG TPA: GHMP kinase [Bacteroidales bacterium]|jgi:D-glycero-alpha-D-manno-heptose-7-phosphate kinase|nr:GHMP kinase [Paludibacteraceae bacterium]HRT81374.1 GHMP kinase [Bacteroidales bacterium]